MQVDHLHGGELFDDAARRQARRQGVQAAAERDVEAIGEEGDEDMRLNPRLVLVKDRPNGEVAFEVLERLFDAAELKVKAPQPRRIVVDEIGAQEIAALAPPGPAQFGAIETIAERGAVRGDVYRDQAPGGSGLLARAPSRISSSSRESFILASCLSRPHNHFSCRRRIERSLATRSAF